MLLPEEKNKLIYVTEPRKTNVILNKKEAYSALVIGNMPSTNANGTNAQAKIDITSLGATSVPIIEYAYATNITKDVNFPLPYFAGVDSMNVNVSKEFLYMQNSRLGFNNLEATVCLLFNRD